LSNHEIRNMYYIERESCVCSRKQVK